MNIVCWGEPTESNKRSISEAEALEAEFHFNYWPKSVSDHTQKTPYLDIGVKFCKYADLDSFHFWFPNPTKKQHHFTHYFKKIHSTTLTEENFEDLGCLLKDNELASSIFNQNLHIASDATKPKQLQVTNISKEVDNRFIIYELTKEDIHISSNLDGIDLTIYMTNIISVSNSSPIYVRFRLKGDFLKSIERIVKVKNKLFQSAFTQTSYIDFRFNDTRSMHKSLREHYLNKKHLKLKISKVHFLLMTRSEEEVTTPANISARILEPNIWTKYLTHKICNVCVANHWRFSMKNDNAFDTCIVYARYKVLHCNMTTIFLYILLLLIMTLIFNLISNAVYDYLLFLLQQPSP